jgi:hypothetical protein
VFESHDSDVSGAFLGSGLLSFDNSRSSASSINLAFTRFNASRFRTNLPDTISNTSVVSVLQLPESLRALVGSKFSDSGMFSTVLMIGCHPTECTWTNSTLHNTKSQEEFDHILRNLDRHNKRMISSSSLPFQCQCVVFL